VRSIGARTAVYYAAAATATLAGLFVAGYLLLESRLTRGLDLLNEAGFRQVQPYLGPDYDTLTAPQIEERIRRITDHASTLFYFDVHVPGPKRSVPFRSTNLLGHTIPDVPGKKHFTADVDGIGELRVAEFYKGPAEVLIATPYHTVRSAMSSYVRVCVLLLSAMVAASLLIGRWLSGIILSPVRLMRDAATRIGSDNLSERILVPSVRDEISDLARLLNQMFDRLEASFKQIRRFTADASHELKIPLSVVRLHAEKMLNDEGFPAAYREALQDQLEEIGRLQKMIDQLLFLSRADAHALKLDLVPHDPRNLLQGFAPDASVLAEHDGRRFTFEHAGHGAVAMDPKLMRQVLLNLVMNAIKASPPDGLISLHSQVLDGVWRLCVNDEGPGLRLEDHERIFDRFVRIPSVDRDYSGSGLGLAISRSIVSLHSGKISAVPGPNGRGLSVVVELPATVASPPKRGQLDGAQGAVG
jgi:two-component system heavy metal sensor histidine kinase CusS